MYTVPRRFCAIVMVALMCLPVLAHAADKPVAWFALRSYQRLEQRLREFSTMAKTPGLADILLGMVQLQLAGLGGLDRQRPLGVIVPTVSMTESPPVAVVLPYTEKDAMLQTLRGFFPQTIVEDGVRLSLQGGPVPAFGHLDTHTSTLVVATTPDIARGVELGLPADLFGAQDSGPDLVFRVDVDRVKQRLDTAWNSMLANLEQAWQTAAQRTAAGQGATAAEQTAVAAYMRTVQKGLRQGLDDFSRGEGRLTLAPTGWVLDLETRMRPGSPSATLLSQQATHVSRAAQLFSPDSAMRMVYNVRMTDTLRQESMAALPAFRQMLEARLAALPTLTPEQREAGKEAITTSLNLMEKWFAQQEIEAATEMRIHDATGFDLTSWTPFPDGANALAALLSIMEKLPLLAGNALGKVSRNVAQYRDIPLHSLEVPKTATTDRPESMFIAAPGNTLAFHLGSSPEPLKELLNRMHTASSQPPVQTDALLHVELFLAPFLKLAATRGDIQDPVGQALATRLQQGANEPLLLELLTPQDSVTVRYVMPGAVVQGIAEVAGQQIMQQMRAGSGGRAGSKPKK